MELGLFIKSGFNKYFLILLFIALSLSGICHRKIQIASILVTLQTLRPKINVTIVENKQEQKESSVYAVIVGIADYDIRSDLKYSVNDAHALNTFLASPEGGALSFDNRVLLIDNKATKDNILKTTRQVLIQTPKP